MGKPLNNNYTVVDDVLFQKVNGELVLLHLGADTYFGLNEVGARVWSLLQEGLEERRIVDSLVEEYDASAESIETDVRKLLMELVTAGLIEVSS